MRDLRELTGALATAGVGFAAFAGLSALGVDPQVSLTAGLVAAGLLKIRALAALNGEHFAPTSGRVAGDTQT